MNSPLRQIFANETKKAVFETGNTLSTTYSRAYVEWLERSVLFLMSRLDLVKTEQGTEEIKEQ